LKYYAELTKDKICNGLKMVKTELNNSNVVEVDSMDQDLLYRQYDPETQTWSNEKFLPDRPAIQLQEFDQLKADKEALEVEVTNLKSNNASNLMTMAKQDDEIKSTKSLTADMLLKMARNSIN